MGMGMTSGWNPIGPIGAGGRMLADDVVLAGVRRAGFTAEQASRGIVPGRVVRVTTDRSAAGFMAPDGTAYIGVHHLQVQRHFHQNGIWQDMSRPPGPSWIYGSLGNNGLFQGELLR